MEAVPAMVHHADDSRAVMVLSEVQVDFLRGVLADVQFARLLALGRPYIADIQQNANNNGGRDNDAGAQQGHGKGSPLPPPGPKGKGKGAVPQKKQKTSPQPPISLVVRTMAGEEIQCSVQPDALVQVVKQTVGKELTMQMGRVRLVFGSTKLEDNTSIDEYGIVAGSVLSLIVMPPVYGNLSRSGVRDVPDAVLRNKLLLNDEVLSRCNVPRPNP